MSQIYLQCFDCNKYISIHEKRFAILKLLDEKTIEINKNVIGVQFSFELCMEIKQRYERLLKLFNLNNDILKDYNISFIAMGIFRLSLVYHLISEPDIIIFNLYKQ